MGRGRTLKTKTREMKALAAAAEEGRLQAKYKMIQKQPWGVLIKEYIGEMIKKVDPIKLSAAVSITPLVKAAIDASPEILGLYQTLLTVGSPVLGLIFNEYVKPGEIELNEVYAWFVSFGLAVIIVENFGEILAAGQSIGGWLASLIA